MSASVACESGDWVLAALKDPWNSTPATVARAVKSVMLSTNPTDLNGFVMSGIIVDQNVDALQQVLWIYSAANHVFGGIQPKVVVTHPETALARVAVGATMAAQEDRSGWGRRGGRNC